MKKWMYLVLVLVLVGCETDFQTWKDLNTDWLAQNKVQHTTDNDLKILSSGVQYQIFHNGPGSTPKPTNSVVQVTYTAKLVDGTVCDSGSEKWLAVSDLIPGWQEALCMMSEPSYAKIYVPYTMAYGVDGSKATGGNFHIPPYSTIIFEIDLHKVENY
ncbi:MAG: FKBP-type peptidyl-prolyl cis-trans isomerase [Paludibacteraceae bacterium]|nr:FKBP-type peptidyl-prolyl cis-trans isomerase [Paludibacteraceae bacterium]